MKEEYIKLNDGSKMPRLGMGTWYLGESKAARKQEIEALRAGIQVGCRLIDTAEMYGSGKSEQLIGEAIQGIDRSSLFIVSKVYPHNAGRAHIFDALARTGTVKGNCGMYGTACQRRKNPQMGCF